MQYKVAMPPNHAKPKNQPECRFTQPLRPRVQAQMLREVEVRSGERRCEEGIAKCRVDVDWPRRFGGFGISYS